MLQNSETQWESLFERGSVEDFIKEEEGVSLDRGENLLDLFDLALQGSETLQAVVFVALTREDAVERRKNQKLTRHEGPDLG